MNVKLKNTRFKQASLLGTLVIDKDKSLIYIYSGAREEEENTAAEIQ